MNVQQKQQKGFTIIEVILVLAIAGLIFLMVFLALPALQRGQRDTQRKNDVSRAVTALQNYQSNARGALPTNWATFEAQYLKSNGDSFSDPSTNSDYTFVSGAVNGSATFDNEKGKIHYTVGSTCSGDGSTLKSGAGSGKVALQMKLEGGGFDCANN